MADYRNPEKDENGTDLVGKRILEKVDELIGIAVSSGICGIGSCGHPMDRLVVWTNGEGLRIRLEYIKSNEVNNGRSA